MSPTQNVLFIMCDQLRFDYLSCAGHPTLRTPNIDALAAQGVRFDRAYAQSPICGPSRMSTYTGRYMRSHGSTQNGVPLRAGEPTLGDHLAEIGVRNVLVGKTHMVADRAGLARLGIDPASEIGVRAAQCGFEPYERDDGLHPDGGYDPAPAYDTYLRAQGFDAENPWEYWANSAEGAQGETLNGWLLVHGDKPARIPAEHSETAYMTARAIDFIEGAAAAGQPWCLHLSFIKPHWPYIAPAPYHALYGPTDVKPAVRSDAEQTEAAHPIFRAFQQERYAQSFARDEVRERVIPAYMGLIAQIDDEVGRLLRFLDDKGLRDSTLIVFTADHGDYLGDHWLGEKQLFHDVSAKVPLIVVDPAPAADATRGTVNRDLVELIDLAPTFLDWFGGAPKPHVLEGHSLLSLTRASAPGPLRAHAVSEYDYAVDGVRRRLGTKVRDCRLVMITDGRFKLITAPGFRPILFDLDTDPGELTDLGADPAQAETIARLTAALLDWYRGAANRITVSDGWFSDGDAAAEAFDPLLDPGILIGYWDEAELEAESTKRAAWRAARAGR
ncbi:alkaline phosphatase family protein [Rhodobacter capsulatus]|uniref:Alkaline phosphatase family protein n=1 Tax=Rhodobacter capsulatus TaxID=1061 RepID=A0A4U1JNV0_RHOCA|nr:alkaline phosphatase family protein [Rhodobacter capsulatus]TKD14540.1 alkaline phosphatase family protein [Rhodobacter capsulatus]